MRKFVSITVFVAICLVAGSGLAQWRLPEAGLLHDYDVRATSKGLQLGAETALPRGPQAAPGDEQQQALAALQARLGAGVRVRWSRAGGTPRLLQAETGFLSAPDGRDPALVAMDFLGRNQALFGLDAGALAALTESGRYSGRDGRITLLRFEQQLAGVPVHQATVGFALTADGRVAQVSTGSVVTSLATGLNPALGPEQAVVHAARHVGQELSAPLSRVNPAAERVAVFENGPFLESPEASLVIFPMARDAVRLGWLVHVRTPALPASYVVIVDAVDGGLLWRYNLTHYAQILGDVFAENPQAEAQVPTTVPFPDDSFFVVPQSPEGWVFPGDDRSMGNNVDAKEDNAGDDELTVGARSQAAAGPPLHFSDPYTNAWETSGDHLADRLFSVTQGFYLGNVVHDWFYELGFTEAAGNFQLDNFGLGGRGNDFLYVDVGDSVDLGRFNNISMTVPPEGSNPRADFMLSNIPEPRRDPSLDGDAVIHELTHGLSHRLVGGQVGCIQGFQGGAMDEGWSDFYAMCYYDDSVVGEYTSDNPVTGERSHDYAVYPACHVFDGPDFCAPTACAGFITPCEIHDEGQLWAAVLWEMREALIADLGNSLGNDVALTLVTDGLKLTPCIPSFLDARDAILMADTLDYAGAYQCHIWQAFADREMGFSAATTGPDDTTPAGDASMPPQCINQGSVSLSRSTYGCDTEVVITVADGNQVAAPTVSVTTTNGDTESFPTTGSGPTFVTAPVPLLGGVAAPSQPGVIEVDDGGSFTVTYTDPDVGDVMAQADVSCTADVSVAVRTLAGGCDADEIPGWPEPLPVLLDGGETLDIQVSVFNNLASDIENAQLTLTSISSSFVSLESPATVATSPPTVVRSTGGSAGNASIATYTLTASNLAVPEVVTLSFDLTGKGYGSTSSALTVELAVHMDYQAVDESTASASFETDEEGYTSYPWPGSSGVDEWVRSNCAASAGTWAFRAGNADCVSAAAEQNANLESPVVNPYAPPLRPSYYPLQLSWQHQLELAADPDEQVWVALSSPGFLAGAPVVWNNVAVYYGADNTGGSFAAQTLAFAPSDTFDAGMNPADGMAYWFDFWTESSPGQSTEWIVDEVQLDYRVAEATDQGGRNCSVGYYGPRACAGGNTMMYNWSRVDEAQFAGNGRFWVDATEWNMLDSEFPTPTTAGEYVGLVSGDNPDNGAHQGTVGLNGLRVAVPGAPLDFGATTCENIPTPIGPSAIIAEGQPIVLQWNAVPESGPEGLVRGYNVYRINAETFPAASSTIDNYVNSGVLVGSTAGQANINTFTDIAPPIVTAPTDQYTYVIQPLLVCNSFGQGSCAGNGVFPHMLNASEGDVTGGKPNVSTDSWVGDLQTNQPGTVRVEEALLAVFSSYRAEKTASGTVQVSWETSAEIQTLGFEVWWGSDASSTSMMRATSGMIRAQGPGSLYIFETDLPASITHFQIREVALSGAPTRSAVFGLEGDSQQTGSSRRTRAGGGRRGDQRAVEGNDDGQQRLRRRR